MRAFSIFYILVLKGTEYSLIASGFHRTSDPLAFKAAYELGRNRR